ncbi:riboflavin synthase [Clostridium fermenticellae]|uniref:Riboflavin synthase n=1 Tax=Clostridium fermenticellae TaxID=2068654 RepID=A0A386H5E1_9CLOT|nr:riboflavin synthase [Clostridium fermenticellae]AYD40929.1 riboflavin synthase [Clostridium fermenticellae]
MFTGLIEEIGEVSGVFNGTKSARIVINANKILHDIKVGDSIAVNGVCLTVTDFSLNKFSADVMPETLRKSSLGKLKIGSKVNLERAMAACGRFGGHIVSGHIDGTGKVLRIEKEDTAIWISIGASLDLLKYIVLKGSITLDGVSLTAAYVDKNLFKVSIIPHTKEQTTLITKNIGDELNIECDVIAKYIEKLIKFDEKSTENNLSITEETLIRTGFI